MYRVLYFPIALLSLPLAAYLHSDHTETQLTS